MPTAAEPLVVIDASVVVVLLADAGELGEWAAAQVSSRRLVTPDHLVVEAANALHRLERQERLSRGGAARAHRRLLALPVDLVPYVAVSGRVWELRHVLSSYDASYVAVAERLEVPLVTLDGGIAKAPGVRCEVRTFG